MQALAAAPDLVYSKATLLCYYWIIREIYTAEAPEWNIGGARAARDGRVSAFITNKCVLSIVRFAHTQKQTALFIDSLCAFEEQKRLLEANNEIPRPYKDAEMQRLRFSCYIALHRYGKTLALPFKKPDSPEDIDNRMQMTLANLKKTVKSVTDTFEKAVEEVNLFRAKEKRGNGDSLNSVVKSEKRQVRFHRSTFGHERGKFALEQGRSIAKEVSKLFADNRAPDPIEVLKEISGKLRDAAVEVLKMLEPTQNFLSSVLNRELAAVSLGTDSTWEPHEMAFAAASLGMLGKRWRADKRLLETGFHLSRAMSDRGEFPFSRPFHSINGGDLKVLYPASALRPFIELVRCVPGIPVDLGIVENMLRYFEETRMGRFGQNTNIGTEGTRNMVGLMRMRCSPTALCPVPLSQR